MTNYYATITEIHTGKKFFLPYLSKNGRPRVYTTGGGIKVFRNGLAFDLRWSEHGKRRPDGSIEQPGFDLDGIAWTKKSNGRTTRQWLATWYPVDGKPESPKAEFRIETADHEDRIGVIVFKRKED